MVPLSQLTQELLAQSRVIARGRGIRDLERLLREHGGTAKGWVKKSTPPLTLAGKPAEIHWYEHRGLGRFEGKVKWLE